MRVLPASTFVDRVDSKCVSFVEITVKETLCSLNCALRVLLGAPDVPGEMLSRWYCESLK